MRKRSWKNILSIGLAVLVLFGAVGAVAAFATNDSEPVSSLAFSRGGLDPTTGKYVETKQTIYTEKAFLCEGLRVEPDFESTVTYDVYFYDADLKFLEAFEGLTEVFDMDYYLAKYARIVIHPEIPDDVDDDEFKVSLFEVNKYARMLKISVLKEPTMDIEYKNLYDSALVTIGSALVVESNPTNINDFVSGTEWEHYRMTHCMKVDDDIDGVLVFFKAMYPPESYSHLFIGDENGDIIAFEKYIAGELKSFGDYYMINLKVPKGKDASCIRFTYNNSVTSDIYIYTYTD